MLRIFELPCFFCPAVEKEKNIEINTQGIDTPTYYDS